LNFGRKNLHTGIEILCMQADEQAAEVKEQK